MRDIEIINNKINNNIKEINDSKNHRRELFDEVGNSRNQLAELLVSFEKAIKPKGNAGERTSSSVEIKAFLASIEKSASYLREELQVLEKIKNQCESDCTILEQTDALMEYVYPDLLKTMRQDMVQGFWSKAEALSKSFDNGENSIVELAKVVRDFAEKMNYSTGDRVLELCGRLTESLDLFESSLRCRGEQRRQKLIDSFNGLRSGERLRVILTGEYSAGKTTFIKRILREITGPRTPTPQTAFLVRHTGGPTKSLKVNFNKGPFCILAPDKKASFGLFLKEFQLDELFLLKGNDWVFTGNEVVFDDWGDEKCLEFLSRADQFHEAIKAVNWCHPSGSTKGGKRNRILEKVELFDMPGFGGKEEHTPSIESIIMGSQPDIILYIVDTDRGVPAEEEINSIKSWMALNSKNQRKPLFFWVFQKPSSGLAKVENESGDWLEEKKAEMAGFVGNLLNKGVLQREEFEVLSDAAILDARGDVAEYEKARLCLAFAIGSNYVVQLEKYLTQARSCLEEIPVLPEIITHKDKQEEYAIQEPTQTMKEGLSRLVTTNPDITSDSVAGFIMDSLGVSRWSEKADELPDEFKHVMQLWSDKVKSTIRDVLNEATPGFFKKTFLKDTGVSLDFFGKDFSKRLDENQNWIESFYLAQAATLLSEGYRNKLAGAFLKDIESRILGNLETGLVLLKDHIKNI